MAATVVDATAANVGVASKLIEVAIQNLLDNIVANEGGKGAGVQFSFGDSATLATTSLDEANDTVRLFWCPEGSYINDFRGTITDVDTNATPTLVYSIVVLDSTNTVMDTLVASSTKGQAGGTDRIADAAAGQYVGDRWIALKVGTGAATPAAGTYKWFVSLTPGLLSLLSTSDQDPAMTDVAV